MIEKLKTVDEITKETGMCYSNARTEEIVTKVNDIIDYLNRTESKSYEQIIEILTQNKED